MALPTKTDEWVLESASSTTFALHQNNSVPIQPLGPDDVLLEIKAVALNYRDLAIARGLYPFPTTFPLVPTNDASALILATGSAISTLPVGTPVILLPAPLYTTGPMTTTTHAALGDGNLPGLLRRHVVVPASWVARYPSHLSFLEAATIGVAGLTAWNALFGSGLPGIAGGSGPRGVRKGDVVLTQGTGAVAMFAAGFAVHAGARVIGTTSSEEKVKWLKEVGVDEVLNYREDERWGETARKLTKDGEGVDLVVDVGGAGTLGQSLQAVRYDGTVAVVGFITAGDTGGPGPGLMDVLPRAANVRGILAGSREQYEEMVGKMEDWDFRPVVDKRVFGFGEAREAFEYLWAQKHIGKVVIDVGR
ncbi:hypothetical protein BU16DRAFT_600916 [Lophium mytilinum]|uniref:Enoyl reductase (ER) domain-containing protein n=1 Tax=Lophium mytilinum TaxID=390894 RepID=A0A6A6Q872_9PEZI|nr:hypothetical protein BU16DRAFT_600916 [Lophium mytilinum]